MNTDGTTMYARWTAGVSSTPRFSARATNQRPEDILRWDKNRATPRSARSNQTSSQGNSSRERQLPLSTSAVDATGKKTSPRKCSPRKHSPRSSPRSNQISLSHADSSTRDLSNVGDCERTALADLPELPEEEDIDDLEDESHGVLTVPAPGGARSVSPPRSNGRAIGRVQDTW